MARLVTSTLLLIAALAILSTAHAQDGTLDTTYGTDGYIQGDQSFASSFSVQSDLDSRGRLLFAETEESSALSSWNITRFTEDGEAVPFLDGRIDCWFGAAEARTLDANDGVIVSGHLYGSGARPDCDIGFPRLLYALWADEDGVRKPEFGGTDTPRDPGDGVALYDLGIGTFGVRGVALGPDAIYIGISASQNCGVAAISRTGDLLEQNGETVVWLDTAGDCQVNDLAAGPSGLVMLSTLDPAGDPTILVSGLTFDRAPWTAIGGDGSIELDYGDGRDLGYHIATDDDRFLISGVSGVGSEEGTTLFALRSDGTTDPSFGDAGLVWLPPQLPESSPFANVATRDGSVFATVSRSDESIPYRGGSTRKLRPDGSLDRSFGDDGSAWIFVGHPYEPDNAGHFALRGTHVDADGDVLVSGIRYPFGSAKQIYGWKLNHTFAPPVADLSLDFKLLSSNEVPNEGGGVRVRAKVTNDGTETAAPNLWAIAFMPDGNTSLVVRPRPREIPAGRSYAKRYRLRVPKDAPVGDYKLTYYVGTFPDEILASETLDITKLPPSLGASAPTGTDWELTLEEDDALAPLVLAPNPASGTAWVNLDTRATVTVRDALGREVARHDAEAGRVALDLSRLAPGVYVVVVDGEGDRRTARLTVVR